MTTFIFTFLVFVLLIAAMAIGVLVGRKPIKGSCGGMSALGIDTECDICGGNPQKCEEQQEKEAGFKDQATDLTYNAAEKPQ
jgi:hypothetical protein